MLLLLGPAWAQLADYAFPQNYTVSEGTLSPGNYQYFNASKKSETARHADLRHSYRLALYWADC